MYCIITTRAKVLLYCVWSSGWRSPNKNRPAPGPATQTALFGIAHTAPGGSRSRRCLCGVYAQASPLRSDVSKSLPPGRIHNTHGDLSISLCVMATHLSPPSSVSGGSVGDSARAGALGGMLPVRPRLRGLVRAPWRGSPGVWRSSG
jgi:hypothetical protein